MRMELRESHLFKESLDRSHEISERLQPVTQSYERRQTEHLQGFDQPQALRSGGTLLNVSHPESHCETRDQ